MAASSCRVLRKALCAWLFACALCAANARADEVSLGQAQRHFERGLSLSEQGRWPEARDAFLQSARLSPRASTYYNLALSSLELGQGRDALAALGRFDQLAGADVPEQHKLLAAALRTRALAIVGALRLSLEPQTAQVEIDGELEPTGAPPSAERLIWLDPGAHVVRVSAHGMQSQTLELVTTAQTTLFRRVELSPAMAPHATAPHPTAVGLPASSERASDARSSPAAPARPARDDDGGSLWSEPATWIVIGAVVAAGATGAVVLATHEGERRSSADGGTTGVVF